MLIQTDFRQQAHPSRADGFVVSALLAHARPCAVTLYAENSVIYAQGDAAGPLYLVEFGAVRLCRLTADGRRQISAFHFAGEVFGFEFDAEHHHFAESVDSAGIRLLRRAVDDHLAESVLPLALRNLSRAQDHLLVLGRQNATEKIAAFLLDLAERQDADTLLSLPMQRTDIADYLGLTFETVSRILRKLKDARIIQLPTIKQVEVINLPALERLCG
ncbi:CRP/FNR family nitrogen fixation transcriptional regulator [Devosia sp. UYZn731]|uniref:helix-turn-helix domain-containing protein n=1 Tax=Devosia sp. UYZn731 TaxID=3156345 RepID=UPI003392ACCA